MKELDLLTLISVFNEMLGPLLWLIVAVVVLGTLAFLGLLVRERKIFSRRLMWSQAVGLFGGVMSLVIMAKVSASGYSDAVGPADWILLMLVFAAGAIGTTVIAYTLAGWVRMAAREAGAGRAAS